MADSTITVGLEVINNASAKIDQINKSINGLETSINKLSGKSRVLDNLFANIGSAAVIGAFKAVGAAASQMFDVFVTQGVAAASKDADAMNALTFALAQTGNAASGAAEDFGEFAEQLQKTTKFGSDQIVSAGALLTTLTGLSGSGLERATKASADLASALRIDLGSAAQLVAKSIEGNSGALGRYGIKVQEGATETARFANTMAALGKLSGASEAQLNTFSGASTFMSNAFEEIQKVFGNIIVQNPAVSAAIKSIGQIFLGISKDLQPLATAIAAVFADMIAWAFKFGGATLEVFDKVTKVFKGSDSDTIFKKYIESMQTASAKAAEAATKISSGSLSIETSYNSASDGAKKLSTEQQKLIDQGKQLIQKADQDSAKTQDSLLASQHEQELISDETFYAQKQLLAEEQLQREIDAINLAAQKTGALDEETNNARLQAVRKYQLAESEIKITQRQKDLKDQEVFLNTAKTLSSAKSKELAAIGKAAAITQVAIATPPAIASSFAFGSRIGGPILGGVFAAIAATAQAVQAAKIAGLQLASGIDSVPGFGSRDSVPAMLTPGERVVPRNTNADLREFLADSVGLRDVMVSISNKLDRLSNNTTVQIGDRVIANEVRSAIEGGRVVFA